MKKIKLLLVFLFTSTILSAQIILVSQGSDWKYLDDGSNQDTAWRYASYDDSGWAEGPAELGYGDGDEATVVSYGSNPDYKYVTTYFRHFFTVGGVQEKMLMVKLLRDDGAVVYLNGEEVVRSNMPQGTIQYETFAASTISGGAEDTFYEFLIDTSFLNTGQNLLAVEIHQRNRTSSDISFNLQLETSNQIVSVFHKNPYLVFTENSDEMKVTWQLTSQLNCEIKWGIDTLCTLGNAITQEFNNYHQHEYIISGLSPGGKYYYKVLLPDESQTGSFYTVPEENQTSLKFISYGDTRSNPETHDIVAAGVVDDFTEDELFQSFLLSVGDLVNDGNSEEDWDNQFFSASFPNIRFLMSHLPFTSPMGNHEGFGILFRKYFSYPFVSDRYWSFEYGPALFVIIDQYVPYYSGTAQYDWIESTLANSDKVWKFLSLHEPGWSAGGHSNNTIVQNHIQPLCEQYNVSIVFAGHNHYYARAYVNNVTHLTVGGGGAPLGNPITSYPYIVTATKANHYCKIEIDSNFLEAVVVKSDGTIIDEFTIDMGTVGVAEPDDDMLTSGLLNPMPNPFVDNISIRFLLNESKDVSISILDIRGREMKSYSMKKMSKGQHTIRWDGKSKNGSLVPGGIYIVCFRSDDHAEVKRIIKR